MNIKYLKTRFLERLSLFLGTDMSLVGKIYYLVAYLCNYVIYGTSINDYFFFKFYTLNHRGKEEYITYRRFFKIQNLCNNKESINICRSKLEFNRYFSDFLGRDWLDVDSATLDEFCSFFAKHKTVFVKEIDGCRGRGVRKVESNRIDCKQLFTELRSEKDVHFVLDEEIEQIQSLHEFHPWSINTLRIVTLYDTKNDVVHIVNARLRLGNNRNSVDNLHFGGIGANVDIVTGVVDSMGCDSNNRRYVYHPLTKKQIVGFQIPYWKECLDYVNTVARLLPTVRYVGWDIVIKQDGSFLLIEANDNADYDFQQFFCGGLWKQYKSIIKNF